MTEKTNLSTILFQNNEEQAIEAGYKLYNRTKELCDNDVKIIMDWIKTQKHLPEIMSEKLVRNLLKLNKYSIEVTKRNVDMYYTIRTLIPEIFENKHPLLPHMVEAARVSYCVPLPKMTDEMNRVTIFKVNDTNVDKYNVYDVNANTFNVGEIRLTEDAALSNVLVYDFTGLTLGHVLKLTPIHLKKIGVVVEEVYSSRVHQIHLVNFPIAESLVNIVKQAFINPKLKDRFVVHKDHTSLAKHIPKHILPSDYGGDELSLEELNQLWHQKKTEYKDRFDKLAKMKVDESLRPTPLKNDEVLGYHGNFKKLSVD